MFWGEARVHADLMCCEVKAEVGVPTLLFARCLTFQSTNSNKMKSSPGLWSYAAGVISIKCLLIFCYHSTDFEVHRNWIAITNSLKISEWYTDTTSEWTLDYPPLFAWWEKILSLPAALVDPGMVEVQIGPYFNRSVLIYQRLTVILSDLIFIFGSIKAAKSFQKSSKLIGNRSTSMVVLVGSLLMCNVGLILVDNIHFQYNGLLSGFLLLSIVNVIEDHFLWGACWYAGLVSMKHIYLYLAPAYIAYFLRNYCFTEGKQQDFNLLKIIKSFSIRNSLKLGAVLISIFLLTFGPFIYLGQVPQLLSRLFPFKRGLTHAYWAPNFWALYNLVDLGAFQLMKKLKLAETVVTVSTGTAGYTTGLVQEYDHLILPNVTPGITMILTLVALTGFCGLVALLPRRGDTFLRLLTLCGFTAYMFGWHVHEKAILLVTVPLTLLAFQGPLNAKSFIIISTIANYSLFPLFFHGFETPTKYSLLLAYLILASYNLGKFYRVENGYMGIPFINQIELVYLLGFIFLEGYKTQIHHRIGMDLKFPFLPLLLTSGYSAVGMTSYWSYFCWRFLCDELQADIWLYKRRWMKIQGRLKPKLILEDSPGWQKSFIKDSDANTELKIVGGLDISCPVGDPLNACVCLTIMSYPELQLVDSVCKRVIITQPYVAGFLAFREVDHMADVVKEYSAAHPQWAPQVLLVDGNGILHPRGFGSASHLGVVLDKPTVGVAKNLHLVDGILKESRRYAEELISVGQTIPLENRKNELIGCALKPTAGTNKPVFVSIGHKVSLETAVKLVVKCSQYRVPEPIRQADQISRKAIAKWFQA